MYTQTRTYDNSLNFFQHDLKKKNVREKTEVNYTTFGSPLPGRSGISSSYSYGFNGMMKDDEVHGNSGDFYAAEYRSYDARLGRWLSQDPVVKPWESPYAGFANNPIYYVDPSGLDPAPTDGGSDEKRFTVKERVKNWREGHGYWNKANKYAVDHNLKSWQVTYGKDKAVIEENHVTKGKITETGRSYGYKEHDEYTFTDEGMYYERISGDFSQEYSYSFAGEMVDPNAWNQTASTYAEGMSYDQISRENWQLREEYYQRTSEFYNGMPNYGACALQRPAIDPIDFVAGGVGVLLAGERTAAQNAVNASYNRFVSARAVSTRNSATWTMENGNNVFRVTVPGVNGQSYAVYTKVVSNAGQTLSTVKYTYTNSGTLIHAKPK